MINFEWYRSFVLIYQMGTISKAAEHLYMTQPALSQHLKALETALGHALFLRTPRKMVATPQGKVLYTQLVGSIDHLSSLSQQWNQKTPQNNLLQIGAPLEFFSQQVLNRLPETDLQLWLEFGQTPMLLDKLGRVDRLSEQNYG